MSNSELHIGCSCSSCQQTTINENNTIHLTSMLKLKMVNTILAGVLLILGYLYTRFFPAHTQVGNIIMAIASIIVSIPIIIYGAKGFFSANGGFVTEQLVSIAILASMAKGDFISATLIPIFMVIGHFLEEKSIMGIEEAISGLKKLHSGKARMLKNNKEELIEPEKLEKGNIVLCYPGETILCDGIVIEGETHIDQSSITGESIPIDAFSGTKVFAGTVNLSGKIKIKVSEISSDTVLNKVMELLTEAENSKAPIVKIIEKYITMYLPFVLMMASITLFFTHEISRAIAILVISCPCAMVLASPTAMIAALVVATKNGIMIKNTAFLEVLSEIKTIIMDKTGTVTYGNLEVEKIILLDSLTEKELMEKASLCASGSIHPVSKAIRNYAYNNNIDIKNPDKNEELPGKGVFAVLKKKKYFLGKYNWILESSKIKKIDNYIKKEGLSVLIADENRFLGEIIFSDQPRIEVKESILQCRKLGIENIVLLTGDKKDIGLKIGKFIEADNIISECLPQDKLKYVEEYKENSKVMFIGDGINDALALKASDAGVAIGATGSNIAIQSADIALNSNTLLKIPEMFRLSSRTKTTIHQNILIGTGFSLFMMFLAISGVITPIQGALFHNLGSVFVVINSARLLKENKN